MLVRHLFLVLALTVVVLLCQEVNQSMVNEPLNRTPGLHHGNLIHDGLGLLLGTEKC